jgi:hypothetical protein
MLNANWKKIIATVGIIFVLGILIAPTTALATVGAGVGNPSTGKLGNFDGKGQSMGAAAFAPYVIGLCYLVGVLLVGWAFVKIAESSQEPDIQKFLKYIGFAILAFMAGKIISFAAGAGETITK